MGVKLRVWCQGQFYPELGKKVIELPYDVRSGPSDDQISIEGYDVQADNDGNFLAGNYNEDEEDAINTYGTARQVIDLYENLLGEKIRWSWQKKGIHEPLRIRIRNNDINARFLKNQRCIELDYYGYHNQIIHNCRTVDIIAHEMGHAILDSILPHLNTGSAEQQGIGEAFCDLTAMFLVLNQEDLCEYVIMQTGGKISKPSILTQFGFGNAHKDSANNELRSAINDIKYDENERFPYPYAQIIVGFLYDLFCLNYDEKKVKMDDGATYVYETGRIWMNAILNAYLKCPTSSPDINSLMDLVLHQLFLDKKKVNHLNNRGMVLR